MATQTSMLHIRIDEKLKADAAETIAKFGLTVSDAVRILLTRISEEGGMPAGLTSDPQAHDAWFRAKVREALADTRPTIPHRQVTDEAQAVIDKQQSTKMDRLRADLDKGLQDVAGGRVQDFDAARIVARGKKLLGGS